MSNKPHKSYIRYQYTYRAKDHDGVRVDIFVIEADIQAAALRIKNLRIVDVLDFTSTKATSVFDRQNDTDIVIFTTYVSKDPHIESVRVSIRLNYLIESVVTCNELDPLHKSNQALIKRISDFEMLEIMRSLQQLGEQKGDR
jgi:hypothetical protein